MPSKKQQKKHMSIAAWRRYILGDIYASDDPNQYSKKRKNVIILLVALGGIAGPMSSMMYMPGILAVTQDLHTSTSAVNGTISAYVVFMGISPLFWAALSDTWGRKRMYLLSGSISVVSSIISALSTNIGMLVVFRALQSFGANAGLTLGAGVIADTIPVEERGSAYGIFYTGPLLGPVIGPTIGGFLCQYLGWRSTFYFTAILCGILLVCTALFLPETLRKQRLSIKTTTKTDIAVKSNDNDQASLSSSSTTIHTKTPGPDQHTSFLSTLNGSFGPMLIMLNDPNQMLLMLFTSIIFGSLYIMNPTITQTFKNIYGYTEWQTGLCYLSLGGGFMIGSIVSGRHSDYLLVRLSKRNEARELEKGQQEGREDRTLDVPKKKKVISEMRLQAAIPSFFLMPAGYLIYGWCTEKKVAVYAPLIGLFIYAMGQMWAFTPVSVYLVDTKPGYSATAVGINSCVRCIFAAITTIFSSQAVDTLGNGIIFTILAAIGVLNGGFVLVCYVWGTNWRRAFEKKYMPDLYLLNSTDLTADIHSDKHNERQSTTLITEIEPLSKKPTSHNVGNGTDLDQIERVHTQHSACIA